MAFSCRLYKSTGFNTINVPDRPSLLDSFSYVDTDVIDVLSTYNNSVIRVKLSQAPDWQYYDYLRIGSGSNIANRAYYAITGFRFTSPDVVEFRVVQDTWLTLGGLDAFSGNDPEVKIISGTTQRHHIAKEDDTYAEYNEPDDMLVPSDPLMVLVTQRIFTMDERYVTPNKIATNNVTIVRTCLDLDELGTQDPELVTFPTTSLSGDVTGDIPSPADFCHPKVSGGITTIGLVHGASRLFDVNGSGTLSPDPLYGGERSFELPGERLTVIYIPSGQDDQAGPFGTMSTLQREKMKKALGRARGMGYDTAITASYSLPQGAVSIVTYDSNSSNSTIKSMYPEHYFATRLGSSGVTLLLLITDLSSNILCIMLHLI